MTSCLKHHPVRDAGYIYIDQSLLYHDFSSSGGQAQIPRHAGTVTRLVHLLVAVPCLQLFLGGKEFHSAAIAASVGLRALNSNRARWDALLQPYTHSLSISLSLLACMFLAGKCMLISMHADVLADGCVHVLYQWGVQCMAEVGQSLHRACMPSVPLQEGPVCQQNGGTPALWPIARSS